MATGALFVLCFSHSPGGSELFNYRLTLRDRSISPGKSLPKVADLFLIDG